MTTETDDEDLILSPPPRMNDHGVPSYYVSLASNTSKGSIPFGKSPICRLAINLSEFIAKQVPCPSGFFFLKHEVTCQDFIAQNKDDGIPFAMNSPFCCTNTNIIVR